MGRACSTYGVLAAMPEGLTDFSPRRKEEAPLENKNMLERTKIGKPRMTVLAKAGSKLLRWSPEGEISLRTPRYRWEGNIKMNLGVIGWGSIDCLDLAQDREQWRILLDMLMNIRIPYNVRKLMSDEHSG
jgi:hypothetical protein